MVKIFSVLWTDFICIVLRRFAINQNNYSAIFPSGLNNIPGRFDIILMDIKHQHHMFGFGS